MLSCKGCYHEGQDVEPYMKEPCMECRRFFPSKKWPPDIDEVDCDGCIHKPKDGENYPNICGSCGLFYYDYYEERK